MSINYCRNLYIYYIKKSNVLSNQKKVLNCDTVTLLQNLLLIKFYILASQKRFLCSL